MNRDFDCALAFVYRRKNGMLNELTQAITTEMIDKLISAGFIICGYTQDAKTWMITELGKEHYENFIK
jgi:predicted transcriptional regulator